MLNRAFIKMPHFHNVCKISNEFDFSHFFYPRKCQRIRGQKVEDHPPLIYQGGNLSSYKLHMKR